MRRRLRNPTETVVDTAFVRGVKAWVKRAFVTRRYTSVEDARAHLKALHVAIERLYEFLLYTKGLLPYGDDKKSASLMERERQKILSGLDKAHTQLYEADHYIDMIVDSVTPGTRAYEFREDIRYSLERAPSGVEAEVLRHVSLGVDENVPKVREILDKTLRNFGSYLSRYGGSWTSHEVRLEHHVGRMKIAYTAFASWELSAVGVSQIDVPLGYGNRDPRVLDQYVPFFRDAKALLERRGFGELWYGVTHVACVKCGGSNPYGAHLGVGGDYHPVKDTIRVFSDPGPFVVQLLIHELGHRYYYRRMTRADRARFDSWFGDVKAVSDYGAKDPAEDFAEVFLHYVIGVDMSRDQVERFKAFLASKDRKRHSNPRRRRA